MDKDKENDDLEQIKINSNNNNNSVKQGSNQDALSSNINFNESNKAANKTYDDIKLKSPKKRRNSNFDNEDQALLDELSSGQKLSKDKNQNQSFDMPVKREGTETDSKNESPSQEKKLNDEISKLFNHIKSQRDIGNSAFHSNQMHQAEISYTKAIDYLNHYTIQNIIHPNSEEKSRFQTEKKKALKILKENLSMSLAKQGKFYQAICVANDIITNYDPISESTHRRLLSWHIKINEIEKAKKLSEEIKGKFSDQSMFIPYFETLAKKEISELNMIDSKKNCVNYTPWIVGSIGILSATIALVLICTKKS